MTLTLYLEQRLFRNKNKLARQTASKNIGLTLQLFYIKKCVHSVLLKGEVVRNYIGL